jgi:hypothetical protein
MMADAARHEDPRRLAAETTRAALFQDVVRATSRVLNGVDVDKQDRQALRACKEMLRRVISSDIVLPARGMQQLTSTSDVLAFVRAARPADAGATDYFKRLEGGLRAALRGDRSSETLEAIEALREIFLGLGRLNLDRSVKLEQEEEAFGPSEPLTASLSS